MKKEAEGQSLFIVSNNEQKRRSAALVVRKLQTRMQRQFFKLSDQHGRPRNGGDADSDDKGARLFDPFGKHWVLSSAVDMPTPVFHLFCVGHLGGPVQNSTHIQCAV